ncbi:hypothetical protein ASPVEDRAFT_44772 [Aspergillus versicolor CBS 583.65]|uniref:Uncharacterized protein n=1 Tax=Aspergillus versicolor CBS 583.65 TaxID=1036611 RepID=A0A1L9PUN4_ASPVE|nr:uncharacterized protein ASPVEDRAFT_44772 [Aspergillus versicolor CBS 583.65]OJJ05254.1 hypothetical protein ASPVEDRAFT_44772 [Aspergillus versicolor CBS 583.65]
MSSMIRLIHLVYVLQGSKLTAITSTDPSQLCVYLSNFQLAQNPHTIRVAGPVNTNNGGTTVSGSCNLGVVDR